MKKLRISGCFFLQREWENEFSAVFSGEKNHPRFHDFVFFLRFLRVITLVF